MINSITRSWPLIIAVLLIASCQSQVEKEPLKVINKFEDPEIVNIYDLVDKRNTDSLLNYLHHKNSIYRYEAALGFGSIQDTSVINNLSLCLNDSSSKVRRAAAYALGQTRDSSAIAPLIKAMEVEDSVFVRKEVLKSLGKVVTQDKLKTLQYWPLRTQEDKEGLAWGLYRAGLRNVHDGVSIDLAISLLDSSNTYRTRLGAAHFLSRTRNIDLKGRTAFIIRSATTDVSENVRMACALALRNAVESRSLNALQSIIRDNDYRVRINAIRALAAFKFEETKNILFNALRDSNISVGVTASGVIATQSSSKEVDLIREALDSTASKRVRSQLWGSLLKLATNKQTIVDQIVAEYDSSDDDYYKAGLLAALGNSVLANEFVITKTFAEKSFPISTAGISAISNMRLAKDFPEELKPSFAEIFKEAIETKDIAMIYSAASIITNPEFDFQVFYDSANFLKAVRSELKLPKDVEAIQALDRAISFFEGNEYQEPSNDFNHPINWDLVKTLEKSTTAHIVTNKGQIVMRLLIEDAPGSVANFVKLSREGYYNGKNFHRVVPNFVIQGGCNRGDGFGGENYSIRSEFANLNYEEGTVGMASAGKDTEGTQWFITHSPTPHLDGGYTIFAKVQSGMEVVHQIEVGDKIISVEIK